ncbi:DMT family transporter [Clostridium rectalis]|uniref:DMT family transporter n=1 Tax=Clostridium rectalis TaxID=2040295 RepID=UPI001FAA3F04|nr:DMT family transporter [Clostridium rectalis]
MTDLIKKKGLIADLSLLIVTIIWGSGFVATKNALDSVLPFFITTLRFFIASIFIGMIFFKNIKKLNIKDLKAGFIIGFFLFLAFSTQTVGLQYTTAGKQAFLTGTNVIMVPFIYWLTSGEKPDIYNILSTFLSFIGISLLTLNSSLYINLGDFLTLLCALFFACHIVSISHFTKNHDPIILTFVQFLVATILSLIWMFILEGTPKSIPLKGLVPIAYLAIFSTFIAFLIQNIAQKYTTATHTAVILSLESVFGSILSCILLDELFTYKMCIGCVIILLAIITAETKWNFLNKDHKKFIS